MGVSKGFVEKKKGKEGVEGYKAVVACSKIKVVPNEGLPNP